MATDQQAATRTNGEPTTEEQIAPLRELFEDAPEVGKQALETVLNDLTNQAEQEPPPPVESAGRVGIRLGKVSELTILVPVAPGHRRAPRPCAARIATFCSCCCVGLN